MAFSLLYLVSIKSYTRKTAGDLSWPEMTSATWRGVIGHNILTQDVNSTCKPMFESVLNGFRANEAPFIFLPLTYNWEVAKLTWPKVTDIKIPRYTFHRWGTDINRWKFQGDRLFGVAMTNIQTFSEVRSLDVTWWPDHEWPGSEIFTKCAEKMYKQLCQKRRRSVPPFSSYLQKPEGVFNPPGPARVKHSRLGFSMISEGWCPKVGICNHYLLNLWFSLKISTWVFSWYHSRYPKMRIINDNHYSPFSHTVEKRK